MSAEQICEVMTMRLIDADALINTLQELFDKREKEARFTGDRGVTVTWNDAIYHIKTAPTIEERKTGKWYKPNGVMPPEHFGRHRCSICGAFAMHDWKHHREQLTNYCPNCGARMEV